MEAVRAYARGFHWNRLYYLGFVLDGRFGRRSGLTPHGEAGSKQQGIPTDHHIALDR